MATLQDMAERKRNERDVQSWVNELNSKNKQKVVPTQPQTVGPNFVGPTPQNVTRTAPTVARNTLFDENTPLRDAPNTSAHTSYALNAWNDLYNFGGADNIYRPDAFNFMNQAVGNYSTPQRALTQEKPTMMTSQDFADRFGLTIDERSIYDIFKKGVDTEYALKDREYGAAQNEYASALAQAGRSMKDSIYQATNDSILSGAARGARDATMLSNMLGLQQESVAGATALAEQRAKLGDAKSAAYGNIGRDAFETSQSLNQALAGLAGQNYSADIQHNVGAMDYDATMDANAVTRDTNLINTLAQYDADNYNVEQNSRVEQNKIDGDMMRQLLMSMTDLDEKDIDLVISTFNNETQRYISDNNVRAAAAGAKAYGGGNGYVPPPTSVDTAKNEAEAYVDAFGIAVRTGNPVAKATAKALYNGTAEDFEAEFEQAQAIDGPKPQQATREAAQYGATPNGWQVAKDGTYVNWGSGERYDPKTGKTTNLWKEIFGFGLWE